MDNVQKHNTCYRLTVLLFPHFFVFSEFALRFPSSDYENLQDFAFCNSFLRNSFSTQWTSFPSSCHKWFSQKTFYQLADAQLHQFICTVWLLWSLSRRSRFLHHCSTSHVKLALILLRICFISETCNRNALILNSSFSQWIYQFLS
jgi:hypothetical protein